MCAVFVQDFLGLHMVSGVINVLLGQHSAAVGGLTAAHTDGLYTPLCKGLWLSGHLSTNPAHNGSVQISFSVVGLNLPRSPPQSYTHIMPIFSCVCLPLLIV